MSMEIITRSQAAELGRKTYYTGKPCINGHDSARYTTTGGCKVCARNFNSMSAKRLNQKRYAHAHGFRSLDVKVPEGMEIEVILMVNSLLMSRGYEAINKLPTPEPERATNPPPLSPVYQDPVYTIDLGPEIEAQIERNRREKEAIASQIAETRRQMEVLAGLRDPLTWLNGLGDPT